MSATSGDGDDQPNIFAHIFAIACDGRELPGPESDCSGGVGLDGQQTGFEQRGKGDESATAGNGIYQAAQKGRKGQKKIARRGLWIKKGGAHLFIVDGYQSMLSDADFRRGREERSRVGFARRMADFFAGAVFDEASAAENGDVGGEIAHQRHGVRDEEVGQPRTRVADRAAG